ncbi:hypothetical protein BDV95DRAFT_479776 [Massariosphaeria phaeospora]|uniref:Secreted protein n=1 Tax=Massariosphaeria phaeospora TaxID=100035 RepID=A0A7C8INF7_9PLEO|nr:hypothetical protein BDV95DRAFT_479776 [Massariosphaeria phaeospora]
MAVKQAILSLVLFSSALLSQAQEITQQDFSGSGHIHVLNSSDWRTGNPNQKVGCLDNDGRFVADNSTSNCGVFTRLSVYPYSMSTKKGNCTFQDENTVTNTDSYYGKNDHAWTCNSTYVANINDDLYTIDGFPYPFICFGDVACFYDAKKIPQQGELIPLWQFHWGSQQGGITPGHVMLQLLWDQIAPPKTKETVLAPGPDINVAENSQEPLKGQQIAE